MFASLVTTAAALSSSAKSCISDSSAFLLNSRPPIWRRVKRSLTKNTISSLDEVASGRERSSRASRRIRSLPRLKEEVASPQRLQSVSVRRRVDKISGRRLTRSEFSDQWGDSEISERRDLTAASFKRMTCHLEAKQNVSEDTDDMFDDLFNKYGKVVFKINKQKSDTIKEVDDDAGSLAFAVALAKVASDVKTADIKLLFVKPLVYWTRTRVRDLAETQYGRTATGDYKPNSGTLLDFGDVVGDEILQQLALKSGTS
ncbi:hypothetical protein CASFOL_016748 [Castilleja foliolosa]|uniref:Uncharacterized protein n=1 Tax=Castilleja foliolosa TaxID=1961234 RepID=A0ABD3D946_9LAMI